MSFELAEQGLESGRKAQSKSVTKDCVVSVEEEGRSPPEENDDEHSCNLVACSPLLDSASVAGIAQDGWLWLTCCWWSVNLIAKGQLPADKS